MSPTDTASLDAALAATPSLPERFRLARAAVPGRVVFTTSLGIEDQAVLHGLSEAKLLRGAGAIEVVTLDTGRLFSETLETLAESEDFFRVAIRALQPDGTAVATLMERDGPLGFRRSIEARKSCCDVRKVQPLKQVLTGAAGWITGLRRGQSGGRANVPFAAWDAERGLVTLNPIADWTLEQLEAAIAKHAIPINPLHAKGFPSIGCSTCTRAIAPGEDLRAGRWWWESEDKKECGLHFRRSVAPAVGTAS
jgi:phosphoadenosine phosphosulfate reductase